MIILKKNEPLGKYQSILGGDYSFIDKIKLGGTGSSKVVYTNGIDQFQDDLTGQSLIYSSFQLYPNALLMRSVQNTTTGRVIFEKAEIDQVKMLARRIKVASRVDFRIVHDAAIGIKLKSDDLVHLYVPTTFFKPIKSFLNKGWLIPLFEFSVDPNPPVVDKAGNIASLMLRGF